MKEHAKLFIIILFGIFYLTSESRAHEKNMPFRTGERLIYEVKWQGLKAGTAETAVYPNKTVNGKGAYHFVLTAKTIALFDRLYKCRAKIESYADINMQYSRFLKESDNLGKQENEIIIDFNWETNTAQCSKNKDKKTSLSVLPGTFDVFSIIYYIRTLDFRKNQLFQAQVTDGENFIIGSIQVLKKNTILKLKDNTYVTHRLVLRPVKINGKLYKNKKKEEIHVWMTNDEQQIPVKMKSKLSVGTLCIELVALVKDKHLVN